jgi:hypothetical protein
MDMVTKRSLTAAFLALSVAAGACSGNRAVESAPHGSNFVIMWGPEEMKPGGRLVQDPATGEWQCPPGTLYAVDPPRCLLGD